MQDSPKATLVVASWSEYAQIANEIYRVARAVLSIILSKVQFFNWLLAQILELCVNVIILSFALALGFCGACSC